MENINKSTAVPSLDKLIREKAVYLSDLGGPGDRIDSNKVILVKDLKNITILSLISTTFGDHSEEYEQIAELYINLQNGVENSNEQPKCKK